MHDHVLLEHIQKGDASAFSTLVQRHAQRFFRIACRVVAQDELAQEALQEAWLTLWQKPHLWDPAKNVKFTTWFHVVVTNKAQNIQRQKRMLPIEDETSIEDATAGAEADLIKQEKTVQMRSLMQSLPPRQQTALSLCFYDELKRDEAAKAMGIGVKALESLLMRGKTTLKERLSHAKK